MKHQYKYLYILLLACGTFASCTQSDEPGLLSEPVPVKFSAQIGASASRASETHWAPDDQIGISDDTGAYTNVPYIIGVDVNFVPAGDGQIFYNSTAPVTFSAYYPYNADGGVITASTSDQSKQSEFDFLWSQSTGNYDDPYVHFKFQHRMSRLTLFFRNDNNVDLSGMKFTIGGLVLDGTFNTATGEAVASADVVPAALSVTPSVAPSNEAEASVILFPQTATDVTITVTAEGSDFISALPITQLQPGKNYDLSVMVHATGIEVIEVNSSEWTNDGEEDVQAENIVEKFTAEQLKIGDYVYSDGTFSDGGLRYRLENGTFISCAAKPIAEKTCVGVVFHLRNESSPEDECEYKEFSGAPTGYIVSLYQNYDAFANSSPGKNDQTPDGSINGYEYTGFYYEKYHESYNLYAIEWCMSHATIPATGELAYSSWYLPSKIELILMRGESNGNNTAVLDLLQSNLMKASGAPFENSYYVTCQFFGPAGYYVWCYNVFTGVLTGCLLEDIRYHRAVCAFKSK